MSSINKNINFETIPDQRINTKEIFGIECKFKVFGFKSPNDYVPPIDKNYVFDTQNHIWSLK